MQPCVFATTDTHMDWIKAYCLAENPKAVLGVDMTYECCLFYMTPVTMKHPMFVKKDDPLSHPDVVVPLVASSTKQLSCRENQQVCGWKIHSILDRRGTGHQKGIWKTISN